MSDPIAVKSAATVIATVALVEGFEAITGIKLWSIVPASAGALVGINFSDKMTRGQMAMKFLSAILIAGYVSQAAVRFLPANYEFFRLMQETNLRVFVSFVIGFLSVWAAQPILAIVRKRLNKEIDK